MFIGKGFDTNGDGANDIYIGGKLPPSAGVGMLVGVLAILPLVVIATNAHSAGMGLFEYVLSWGILPAAALVLLTVLCWVGALASRSFGIILVCGVVTIGTSFMDHTLRGYAHEKRAAKAAATARRVVEAERLQAEEADERKRSNQLQAEQYLKQLRNRGGN